jgi:sec-independent protein translocase protein TatB
VPEGGFSSVNLPPRLTSVFDLSGSKILFLIIIALVVLGPDKLPEAMRKAGKVYGDFKRMTSGFQNEMKSVLDEPMRELRETAELAKKSAMFDTSSLTESINAVIKPQSGSMAAVTPVTPAAAAPPAASADPVDSAEPAEAVGATSDVPEATPVPAPVEPVIIEPVIIEPVIIEPVIIEPVIIEPVIIEPVIIEPVIIVEPISPPAVPATAGQPIGDRTSRRLAGVSVAPAVVAAASNVESSPEPTRVVPAVESGVRQPVSEEASVE